MCARHHVTITDLYQTQIKDLEKAFDVANHLALQQKYDKAIEIYEEIGKHCIESSLLKYCATTHFMRAALCHLCVDLLNGELALKRYYEDWFPAFSDSRESKLVKILISKIENEDFDGCHFMS